MSGIKEQTVFPNVLSQHLFKHIFYRISEHQVLSSTTGLHKTLKKVLLPSEISIIYRNTVKSWLETVFITLSRHLH